MSHSSSVRRRPWNRFKWVDPDPAPRLTRRGSRFAVAPIHSARALSVNLQRNPMVREWKNRSVKSTSAKTRGLKAVKFERRQNPHATPARRRLLEQNLAAMNDEGVLFDRVFCARARSFHWQDFWVFGATE